MSLRTPSFPAICRHQVELYGNVCVQRLLEPLKGDNEKLMASCRER